MSSQVIDFGIQFGGRRTSVRSTMLSRKEFDELPPAPPARLLSRLAAPIPILHPKPAQASRPPIKFDTVSITITGDSNQGTSAGAVKAKNRSKASRSNLPAKKRAVARTKAKDEKNAKKGKVAKKDKEPGAKRKGKGKKNVDEEEHEESEEEGDDE
jgi:hypothetical protein